MFEPMPTTIHNNNPHRNSHLNLYQQPLSSQHYRNHQEFGSINQPPPPLSASLEPPISSSSHESAFLRQQQNQPQQPETAKLPLNQQYQSTYQSFADIVDPLTNPNLFIHVTSGQKISRPWQAYISDLDDFFERIYNYYRKSGFVCILVEHLLELLEILLVVLLTFFFVHLVDYDILFKKKIPPGHPNQTEVPLKVTISDCLIPISDISLSSVEVILLIFAAVFWLIKAGIAIYSIHSNYAIRSFFVEALQIHDPTLYSWQEVQTRLIHAQSHCLLRESHLDELAIHNRLLRRVNYMIALVNKGVLPIYYQIPILGECGMYLTSGLEFNLNILLFRGVFSLFDKNWKLRDEIKSPAERLECARRFSNRCMAIGLINFLLLPMIFCWQSLYAFYTYVEVVKRDPTMFSLRTWSRYGRWFCRHFNELEHELDERLNRAHRPATRYMNSFRAPLLEIIARFITFIAGISLSVLIVLTVYDEDVITVEHVLTLITGLGAIIAISRAFLPDPEPNRYSFAELDSAILKHIHYRPHNYPPHTIQAQKAMSNIFVYKSTTILEELISPMIVPIFLIFRLRKRSLEIVDFFRVYTLELTDIGDVCTFSQFNFHQNGHRIFNQTIQQTPQSPTTIPVPVPTTSLPETGKNCRNEAEVLDDDRNTTRNGKLELSLINFKLKNPKWQPHDNSQMKFIDRFTKQSRDDGSVMFHSNHGLNFNPNNDNNDGDPNQELCESKSTIDFRSPNTSMFVGPSSSSLHQQRRPSDQLRSSKIMKTSQIGSDSLMLDNRSDINMNFGFDSERKRLLKLRYESIFSELEEQDNQMALSSLYFHQLVSDNNLRQSQPSQQQQQQYQRIDGSTNQNQSSRSSFQQQQQQPPPQQSRSTTKRNESIPLLKRKDDLDDDDDFESDP